MAININKYVDIRTQFPKAGSTPVRSLGGLVFTRSDILSTAPAEIKASYDSGKLTEMSIDDVAASFEIGSEERKFADGYYGYISPSGTLASTLSFVKISEIAPVDIAEFAENTKYDPNDFVKHDGNLFKCVTAVEADDNTGWDSVKDRFVLSSAVVASDYVEGVSYGYGDVVAHEGELYECSAQTGITADDNVGWEAVEGKFDQREAGSESATMAFARVAQETNMFGSFTFIGDFSEDELVSAAIANQRMITDFMMVVSEARGNQRPSAVVTSKDRFSNIKKCVFISGHANASAYMPMAILASTNYDSGEVTVQMYKQFPGEVATVKNDFEYELFKKNYVNFYGRTQSNGTNLDFYQHGFNTDGTDTAIFCNEMWFKSMCTADLISMQLENERIPANDYGVSMVRSRIMSICSLAVRNGTFMQKVVSEPVVKEVKKMAVRLGGDVDLGDEIVDNVEQGGYYVWAYLESDDTIHYYVFYGTADSIRYIKGDDVLLK